MLAGLCKDIFMFYETEPWQVLAWVCSFTGLYLNTLIMSPRMWWNAIVTDGKLNWHSLSSYGRSFIAVTILVALCCTFSGSLCSAFVRGHQIELAYTMWGLIMALYISGRLSLSGNLKNRWISYRPTRELAFAADLERTGSSDFADRNDLSVLPIIA